MPAGQTTWQRPRGRAVRVDIGAVLAGSARLALVLALVAVRPVVRYALPRGRCRCRRRGCARTRQLYGLLAPRPRHDRPPRRARRDGGFYSLVYPALVGCRCQLHDVALGYTLAKAVRRCSFADGGPRLPLGTDADAAALGAARGGADARDRAGCTTAALLMTEAAFYPAFTLAGLGDGARARAAAGGAAGARRRGGRARVRDAAAGDRAAPGAC